MDDELELDAVDGGGQVAGRLDLERNPRALRLGAQLGDLLAGQEREVHDLALESGRARQLEEVRHDAGHAERLLLELEREGRARVVRGGELAEELGVRRDPGDRGVDLVGEAGRQAAERGEALLLGKALFEVELLGDVVEGDDAAVEASGLDLERRGRHEARVPLRARGESHLHAREVAREHAAPLAAQLDQGVQELAHELLRIPPQEGRRPFVRPQHPAGRVADQERRGGELEDALEVVLQEPVLLDLAPEVRHQEGVLEGEGRLGSQRADQPALAVAEREVAVPAPAVDQADDPPVPLDRKSVPQPALRQLGLGRRRERPAGVVEPEHGPAVRGAGGVQAAAEREVRDDALDAEGVAEELSQAQQQGLGVAVGDRLLGERRQGAAGGETLAVLQVLEPFEQQAAGGHGERRQEDAAGDRHQVPPVPEPEAELGDGVVQEREADAAEQDGDAGRGDLARDVLEVPEAELEQRGRHPERHQREREQRDPREELELGPGQLRDQREQQVRREPRRRAERDPLDLAPTRGVSPVC